jgi:hypothetical protein
MVNRLEPLNLMDFTGGLNLRRNQFQLADNESPDLLNVDIDPRGGFYTRKGWQRWNADDVTDPAVVPWKPRNAFIHTHANGDQYINVVNDHKIFWAPSSGVFAQLAGLVADASPHGADFAAWGDVIYIACGMLQTSVRVSGLGVVTAMSPTTWSEVEAPTFDTMPKAEFIAGHAAYLFAACTNEADGNHFARVRWSHPNRPDAWRADDFLDIDLGGGRITGIMSFRDHLLIFKTNSMWALYGYDEDSWQLIKVSISVGCPAITAATRSETSVYFFSASDKGGIYGYQGQTPVYLSENLRPAFEDIISYENVFVSWAGRRLWVGVPWAREVGSTASVSSVFVLDPDIGERGAWTMYRSDYGAVGPVLDGSDVNAKYPLAAFWSDRAAIMVTLDRIGDGAYDLILEGPSIEADPQNGYVVTSLDQEIAVTGVQYFGEPFDSYYRTRWLHAGWPDRKKSWRRPTFVCRQVPQTLDLLVETFRDYNETTVHRTRTLRLRAEGESYWTETGFAEADIGGFDWTEGGLTDPSGRGADWGLERRGSNLLRSGSMGLARSVQRRVRASPTSPRMKWGVDGIVAKFVQRRFR